jgi:hypothetical protein
MADTLKNIRVMHDAQAGTAVLDGAASHIYTILSVSICNSHASNAEIFSMFVTTGGKANPVYIYKLQPLPAQATFVHNDKIVLNASDELWVDYASDLDDTLGVHVVVSYLDQG